VGGTFKTRRNFSSKYLEGEVSIEVNTGAVFVVDGIIREGGIEDIKRRRHKSIEVLKDASLRLLMAQDRRQWVFW